MSKLVELTDHEFEARVDKADLPVVVDFGAEWCGPCKALAPILEEIANEFAGRVDFYSMDIGKCPETAARFSIMSVPTLVLLKDGEEVQRVAGLVPKSRLRELVASLLPE